MNSGRSGLEEEVLRSKRRSTMRGKSVNTKGIKFYLGWFGGALLVLMLVMIALNFLGGDTTNAEAGVVNHANGGGVNAVIVTETCDLMWVRGELLAYCDSIHFAGSEILWVESEDEPPFENNGSTE